MQRCWIRAIPFGEEQTTSKTAKENEEVQLDICPRSFGVSRQKAFFDVRVFLNEKEKKDDSNTRIEKVDQG